MIIRGITLTMKLLTHESKFFKKIDTLGSPPGFPKLSSIIKVKTPCIEAFFISLESYWSVNVENGFAWTIWTSATQVIAKKKGQESNWQFDSQPLKVENRPDPNAYWWNATQLELSQWKLQPCFRLHPNWRFEQIIIVPQSCGSPNRGSFSTPPWESRDKNPFGCGCRGELQRILYGGRWWLPPSLNYDESCESKVACGLS